MEGAGVAGDTAGGVPVDTAGEIVGAAGSGTTVKEGVG